MDVCVTIFTARSSEKTMQFVTRKILEGNVAFISLSKDFKTDMMARRAIQRPCLSTHIPHTGYKEIISVVD